MRSTRWCASVARRAPKRAKHPDGARPAMPGLRHQAPDRRRVVRNRVPLQWLRSHAQGARAVPRRAGGSGTVTVSRGPDHRWGRRRRGGRTHDRDARRPAGIRAVVERRSRLVAPQGPRAVGRHPVLDASARMAHRGAARLRHRVRRGSRTRLPDPDATRGRLPRVRVGPFLAGGAPAALRRARHCRDRALRDPLRFAMARPPFHGPVATARDPARPCPLPQVSDVRGSSDAQTPSA